MKLMAVMIAALSLISTAWPGANTQRTGGNRKPCRQ